MIWIVWTDDRWAVYLKGQTYWRLVLAPNRHTAEVISMNWFKQLYGFEYGHTAIGKCMGLKLLTVCDFVKRLGES